MNIAEQNYLLFRLFPLSRLLKLDIVICIPISVPVYLSTYLLSIHLSIYLNLQYKSYLGGDSHGGPVVKNLPYNAEDAGSIPGQGTKILHAAGQLSPCATTTELAQLN